MSGYVWKKRRVVRNYMLDMYMWLCPISLEYMLHPKHSHLHRETGMTYYTQVKSIPGKHGPPCTATVNESVETSSL